MRTSDKIAPKDVVNLQGHTAKALHPNLIPACWVRLVFSVSAGTSKGVARKAAIDRLLSPPCNRTIASEWHKQLLPGQQAAPDRWPMYAT